MGKLPAGHTKLLAQYKYFKNDFRQFCDTKLDVFLARLASSLLEPRSCNSS